jgi:hypothetical protein
MASELFGDAEAGRGTRNPSALHPLRGGRGNPERGTSG